ncbi:MAG: AAA family ATPase [Desulfocapsaceae bacterium]|nr:AAA family ATPase [Desulfocapsaceae bacterium]
MYTRYFGLTEKPFSIAPDPHFLYLSDLHREALAHLLYGIQSDGCLVLLTGEVGTGKTTASRFLIEQIPKLTDVALILNPKLSVVELLATICEELRIEGIASHNSVKYYSDILSRHLLESHSRGRNTVLIIDEAQDLDPDILEQLRLLTNLETHKEKLLRIILLGQPELRKMLDQPEFSQINQRITSRYHLVPLQERDVFAYVDHRIKVAGGGRARLFSDKALKRIHVLSRGIPRLINLLCDRSLLGAYVEEKEQVELDVVNKAGREVLGHSGSGAGRSGAPFSLGDARSVIWISLLAALLVTSAALIVSSPQFHELLKSHKQDAAVQAVDEKKAPVAIDNIPTTQKENEKNPQAPTEKNERSQKPANGAKHSKKNAKPVEEK